MMNKKLMLLYIILVFDQVFTQRISKLKCDETASLITDPRSLAPHLMEIEIKFLRMTVIVISTCTMTLISQNFVLTSASCLNNHNWPINAQVTIRKLKTIGEEYTNSQRFTINRIIHHELFNKSSITNKYDYALIQLNETVPYQDGLSIFRPACLWTDLVPPFEIFSLFGRSYQNGERVATFKNISSSDIDRCLDFINYEIEKRSDDMRKSHICFMINRSEFDTEDDNPIVANIGNQYYIFGIQHHTFINYDNIDNDEKMIWGHKIYHAIDWIESIIWPNHSNLECGERKVKHKALMAFSQPTYHGEFPWHVALYKNHQQYICGGTIINKRTILTAAHCVQGAQGIVSPNSITIVAGTHNLDERQIEAEIHIVETIISHPNFTRTYLENDIALLKLEHAFQFSNFIQPICLSKIPDYDNLTLGLVAGWGRDEHNRPSSLLLQATLPIRDNFECRDSNRDFFPHYLNDHNYCAGYQNGTNVCSGDSGGGMIFEYKSKWYIRGIVSLGVAIPNSDRCDITEMVLFTDVLKLYYWIVENVQDE